MKRQLTILYPISDLSRDGTQRQLLELVKGLDKDRYKPIVMTLHPGNSMDREFGNVPGADLLTVDQKGKWDLSCLLRIYRVIRRYRVDVVQPFLTPATLYGLLPALLAHVPLTVITERSGPGRTDPTMGYRMYLKVEDWTSRSAGLAVANSKAGMDYLVRRGIKPERAKVIYNGLDFGRLESNGSEVARIRTMLGVHSGGSVIGVTARLFPVKRHDVFIEAAAIVSQAMPETRFAIVGDGPQRAFLEKLSTERGLTGKLLFFGEQARIAPYISALDIAALSSDTEGFSNSLMEAMALGKPIVATDVGGNQEVVVRGQTGLLVPPGDPEAFAQAILKLLNEPSLSATMGKKARTEALTRFSLSNMVHQYEIIYEQASRRRPNARSLPVRDSGAPP